MNINLKQYITAEQAAEALGLSHSQVCRYLRNGDLDGQKIGLKWFVRRSSVRSFSPNPVGNPQFVRG